MPPILRRFYEQYLDAPESVSPQWRSYFDDIRGGQGGEKPRLPVQERFEALAQLPPLAGDGADSEAIRKQVAVLALISGYRAAASGGGFVPHSFARPPRGAGCGLSLAWFDGCRFGQQFQYGNAFYRRYEIARYYCVFGEGV